MKFLAVLLLAMSVHSCRSAPESDVKNPVSVPEKIDPKYSVAKDRGELEKLRENIPVDMRRQNDEKALIADLTSELKYPPEVVRDKFQSVVRKKRDQFSKDMAKIRDEFNKNEKQQRDEFLKQLQEERDEFSKRKLDRDKRSQFYNEQDEARRNFFADQRDKRAEFEAEFSARRKDFDDYLKDKADIFSEEFKSYQIRWKEKQAEKTGNSQ